MSLLDHNVIFVKGFFINTMKHLKTIVESVAVLRLDGDMYQSTVDVLYNLYDKVPIGGYVIIDDWVIPPCKQAILDFFSVHGKSLPEIVDIDKTASYWQKKEALEVQYWRYEQGQFAVK